MADWQGIEGMRKQPYTAGWTAARMAREMKDAADAQPGTWGLGQTGDEVRKYIKPDMTKKGYKLSWSVMVFKVLARVKEGGETRYNIDDFKLGTGGNQVRQRGTRTRTYARNELLLVKGRETKDTA